MKIIIQPRTAPPATTKRGILPICFLSSTQRSRCLWRPSNLRRCCRMVCADFILLWIQPPHAEIPIKLTRKLCHSAGPRPRPRTPSRC